jgi:hypothetical protein
MMARCKYGKLKNPVKGRRCKKKRASKAWSSARKMRYGKTKRMSRSTTAFAGARRRR